MADLNDEDRANLARLKAALDAGYYKVDAELSDQATGEQFPWQGKFCKDCPFWTNSMCQVHAEYRSSLSHTCVYFDEGNREDARKLIAERAKGKPGPGLNWPWLR